MAAPRSPPNLAFLYLWNDCAGRLRDKAKVKSNCALCCEASPSPPEAPCSDDRTPSLSSHKPAGTRVWRVGLDKSRARPPTSHQVMSKAIWRFCRKSSPPRFIASTNSIRSRARSSASPRIRGFRVIRLFPQPSRGEAPEYLGVGYQTAIARSVVNRSSECGDGSTRFRPNAFAR